jgi:hypothetical protein
VGGGGQAGFEFNAPLDAGGLGVGWLHGLEWRWVQGEGERFGGPAGHPMASSPCPRVSHRFDGHLPEARNTVVHPIVTPFGRHHSLPCQEPVTIAAWWRMGCVLQARRIARCEYIPTPDMHLLRPSACLLRLAVRQLMPSWAMSEAQIANSVVHLLHSERVLSSLTISRSKEEYSRAAHDAPSQTTQAAD